MKRIMTALLAAVTLASLTFAQNPPFGGPPTGNRPGAGTAPQRGQALDPLAGLKTALNLTDAQVSAIQALIQTRRTRAEAIFAEIQQKRQTLDTLLNATSPNAAEVGNAAIALRASERKLAAERDWFISELKKLLTGDQQTKLDTLLAANPGFLGGGGPGPRGPRRGQ